MSKSGVKKTVKISNLQSIVLNDNYPLPPPGVVGGSTVVALVL